MSYLDELVASRRADVERCKRDLPLAVLKERAEGRPERRDFRAALRSGGPAIIAEIKRASPSAGTIARAVDPAHLAAAYERGGAAALSVLTEPRWFEGTLEDLSRARAACRLPVLRKDFIIDEYQIWEAAAAGADAVLLIVAALTDPQVVALQSLARELDLAALVEVHDAGELRRALLAGATLVAINNRDLHTFEVRRSTALELAELTRELCGMPDFSPAKVTVVAESGYTSAADLAECAAAGIDAVLIGEHLMRAPDPEAALRALVSDAVVRPRLKICGMQTPEDIDVCVAAGADALGFIFAESPRKLSVAQAAALTARAPAGVTRVGVFANSPRALIEAALGSCRLDLLQFAGDETPDFCGAFKRPTILVARTTAPSAQTLRTANAVALMADSRAGGKAGGTGIPLPLVRAQQLRAAFRGHFILAGGLKPESVAEAIRAVKPDGVDVRSGVERDGRKDPALVRGFVKAAKEALNVRA
jgi:indole-3-glycerol phosphate synthase / phosphoribosylanthranilate isomerase